jgi:hypothetical protein
MGKQPNSTSSKQSPPPAMGDETASVGQAILGLLHTAANKAETDTQQVLQSAAKLSSQLHTAQGRIADLEAELRLYQEKAQRAEGWLRKISMEIEDRLINEPEETGRQMSRRI